MSNLDIYDKTFAETLSLDKSQLGAGLTYQSVPEWDSVGHMQLIAALEAAFDIMLDTDDIIDLSSYETGKKLLRKYGVEI